MRGMKFSSARENNGYINFQSRENKRCEFFLSHLNLTSRRDRSVLIFYTLIAYQIFVGCVLMPYSDEGE